MNNSDPFSIDQLPDESLAQYRRRLSFMAQSATSEVERDAAIVALEQCSPGTTRRAFEASRAAHTMIANYVEWVDALPDDMDNMPEEVLESFQSHDSVKRQIEFMESLGENSPDLIDVAVALAGGLAQSLARLSAFLIENPELDPGVNSQTSLGQFVHDAVAALVPMSAWTMRNVSGIDFDRLTEMRTQFAGAGSMTDLLVQKDQPGGA